MFGLLFVIDGAFVLGNVTKIAHGGWVPLVLAVLMFGVFIIWRDGRQQLRAELEERAVPCSKLPALLAGRGAGARHRAYSWSATPSSCRPRCCATSSTTTSCTSA